MDRRGITIPGLLAESGRPHRKSSGDYCKATRLINFFQVLDIEIGHPSNHLLGHHNLQEAAYATADQLVDSGYRHCG